MLRRILQQKHCHAVPAIHPRLSFRFYSEERIVDETDVLIVGGGPAGLSTAIRIKQLAATKNQDVRVILLEKGPDVGSHILSGNVFDPIALNELFPDWKNMDGCPVRTPVTKNQVKFLTKNYSIPLPVPKDMQNDGNYIISLGDLCQWLAGHAESLGVEIYSGIAGRNLWLDESGKQLLGVYTNDVGVAKDGSQKPSFQLGMGLAAKVTVLAEGCHGSLTKSAINHFQLRSEGQFQTYALGVKEVWQLDPSRHEQGLVVHTLGYPLPGNIYGGGFAYHAANNLLYLGHVAGLDYENPTFSPYHELQRYKHHPLIKEWLINGKCIQYGARTLAEGGIQSLPKLSFPGGLLVGCAAGFLNTARLKGSHNAIKSGMLAAESIMNAIDKKSQVFDLTDYEESLKASWLYKELMHVRNERPGFKYGRLFGMANAAISSVFSPIIPWTLSHKAPDHTRTKPLAEVKPIEYPKPDGVISFSLLENLSRSGTNHEEDQPCHLTLKNAQVPNDINYPVYGGPESYYCPAGVYEYIETETSSKKLHINAQNCIHCKTCDIKDPTQNINWVTPEGGGGPKYAGM